MPINIGTRIISQLGKIRIGSNFIRRVFMGSTLIWPPLLRMFRAGMTSGITTIAVSDVPQLPSIDSVTITAASSPPNTGNLWRSTNFNKDVINLLRGSPSHRQVIWVGPGIANQVVLNFFVVGSNGLILNSSDGGVTWTSRSSNTNAHLNGVAVDTTWGFVVAVGNDRRIVRNPNFNVLTGTWTRIGDTSAGQNLNDVEFCNFSNPRFVAVGLNGMILYSLNTSTLSMSFVAADIFTVPSNASFVSVAFGNGECRALTSAGHLVSSFDGIIFTLIETLSFTSAITYNIIKFINGVWYVGIETNSWSITAPSLYYQINNEWTPMDIFDINGNVIRFPVFGIAGFRSGILVSGFSGSTAVSF